MFKVTFLHCLSLTAGRHLPVSLPSRSTILILSDMAISVCLIVLLSGICSLQKTVSPWNNKEGNNYNPHIHWRSVLWLRGYCKVQVLLFLYTRQLKSSHSQQAVLWPMEICQGQVSLFHYIRVLKSTENCSDFYKPTSVFFFQKAMANYWT